ncbi:histone-lysine N-methyltransferase 2C-like isoform X3 [Paralichthys olivaceus]|uniref:histone-lysine N-methyltransferase 2C-like isoform X3 n=1 Tax=Paralichthys olivaceus TaxID=8255 RepID=UPI0037517A05
MPSEAQSQEPRDRGPPPPVTRAGRSAQLAKAAATSLSSERRTRGRPRKDGSGGRSAPLAPPAPPSPPPKSRKKGQGRGRAQVEDKESMDATEKKSPHKTEVMEKTTGRRRSTSRRKSNPDPDPEPSQERFSPESKLDPDPPDPDPTIPVSSPEPAHCTDEDRTSPGPPANLPTYSPGPAPSPREEPRLSPLPTSLSLDHSPVQSPTSTPRPAPDLVEEDWPGPSPGPAPIEVDCSPCRVSTETEGGGASPGVSPMEQSPAPSLCSNLPVSPCPQLEDDDSLSLMFQRSLSEDSGGSPNPSLGHSKKCLKQCAFCYHYDKPPLGQGRLVVFGPTPGYIPLHILNRRASSDRDSDCHDHCYRGSQAPPMCSSPEQGESSSEFVEQLGPIGLPHDINVQSLFDPTGQCCAHLQCAAWSEGVCRGEGQSLLYVDKAIDSGSTQVCAFCRRLGASLRCRETNCGRSYHFPCAAAAGAHQDWNERHTLCTRHRQTVSSQCVSCLGSGDVSGLLMCCCCGNCYHGSCLDPPLVPSHLCRVGWHCPECRVCQSCRLQGDNGVLLVCERCDKAYHKHCLTPPLDHTPSTSWSCKNCRICRHCGVMSSGQWANHPFLCESCDPALPCPLCGHTPDLYTPEEYLTCTCCYRCVHTECIVQTGEGRAGSESYICSTCRHQEEDIIPNSLIPLSPTPALPISSTQASPISISQPPICNQDPPMSPSTHSPVQLDCLEPPQSPTKTMCTPLLQSLTLSCPDPSALQSPSPTNPNSSELPEPTEPDTSELQQSPASTHPDPSELQEGLAPTHTDPSELQQISTPAYPDSSELQESPAPTHPYPSVLKESPTPSHPDPPNTQQSPAPANPDPSELKESPAPTHPDPSELQASPAPANPDTSELQESPAPTHPDPSELQESPAPTHPDPSELQESPAPTHPDPSELKESPAPTHPDPSELQVSPAPANADPSELQESTAPTHPDPSELQESPAPAHPDPSELQESPAPAHPDPSELQESPAPAHPDPSELQESPAPAHSDPSELQENPAPAHPDPSELKESPAPTHSGTSEPLESPGPMPPDTLELQESPTPIYPGTSEPLESPGPMPPDISELQESPAPIHPNISDLQESPAHTHPDPSELQESPAPAKPDSSELLESPAPTLPDSSELQASPAPTHPDPSELQESPKPTQPDSSELQASPAPANPDPSELQESPAPAHPDPSELQESPKPTQPDSSELQASPAPANPDPSELQESPAPAHPDPSELQESPKPTQPDSSELQASPAPANSDPSELQESPAPAHPDPSELQESPAPACPRNSLQIQTSSHSNQTEHQVIELPSHPGATELETRLQFCHDTAEPPCGIALLQQSPTQAYCGPTELQKGTTQPQPGPVQLQQSPARMTSTQAQDSPRQHSCPSTSPTLNSTEEQPPATVSQQSPTWGSPLPCELMHSPPPNSQYQEGHSPPQHSPPLQISTQTQRHRPFSPTNIIINLPQHSPPQRWHSSMSHSPAQVGASTPHSPIQDAESTLDQESPGLCNPTHLQSGTARDISTLNQDPSPVYCRLTQTGIRHTLSRSISAPCSPSLSPLRPTQCSLSQPASPVKAHSVLPLSPFQLTLLPSLRTVQSKITDESTETNTTGFKSLEHSPTQLSSNINGQTPEGSSNYELSTVPTDGHCTDGQLPNQLSPVPSSMCSPDQSSPTHVPAPESLVHISTSAEHSSLTFSPCAGETEENPHPASHIHQRPSHDRLSGCMEGKASPIHIQARSASSFQASASPTQTSEMPTSPASSIQACACSMQIETNPAHVSPLVSKSNPSAILAAPVHPPACQDEEIEVSVNHPTLLIQSEAGYLDSTPGSQALTNATNTDPVHTDTNSSYSPMGTIDAQERDSVCSFSELTQNQMSQRPTHSFQSSPLHVQSTCSSSQTTPASFSPPHCMVTGTSSATDQSLSNITSDCSGQTGPHLASIIDVGIIHSPPRSRPAGQASPIHTQSTSDCVNSGPLKRQSPSLTNFSYSSPARTSVACVSPPYRRAQASETYHSPAGSPNHSPSLDTGTNSGLTAHLRPSIVGSNPDMDTLASSIVQSSVLPSAFHRDPVSESSGRIMQMSPEPSSSLLDDLPAASFNQASLSQVNQFPVSPHPDPDRSAPENQRKTALVRPLYQGAPPSVDVTSIQASASHVYSSPTQDTTAMPNTSHTSETPASPPSPAPSQFSPAQTYSSPAPLTQDSAVHSSLVKSPVCGPVDLGYTPTSPSPGPVSPVQPVISPSPVPDATMRCEACPGPTPVSPTLASPLQCEKSLCPGPVSPVQSDTGPGKQEVRFGSSLQQDTETERNSAATEDISMVEKHKVEKKTEEEEKDSEAPQQEEVDEVQEVVEEVASHQITKEIPEEPVEVSEEEDDQEQFPPNTAVSSPSLPQPAPFHPLPPHSVSPQLQTAHHSASSPSAFPLLAPLSPPRAGPLDDSLPSTALPPSCFPCTSCPPSPPLEDLPQKGKQTSQGEDETGTAAEAGLENEKVFSQSQSQVKIVAEATEPTKDKHQSLAEPSVREEEPSEMPQPESVRTAAPEVVAGQQPMRERQDEEEKEEGDMDRMDEEEREGAKLVDQSDVEEEEPVSPVLELDSSFDKDVMELMTSSTPPPSLLHLSSPSPPPSPRRGTLRFPPSSSRPLDDLSIRLRQSPFSTEASPETSPRRDLITPPPLSPPSPSPRSPPSARESPPLSQAPPITVLPLTPKIGMGKPAISKRKFSPGRARVKPGSWSSRRVVSPPSSSQDSTGEGGWDSPKPQPPDSPLWSMRVGRGSGFPSRRRSRGGGVGGGRGGGGGRGRSRLKTQDSLTVSPGYGYVEPFQPKEEEENSMHNTVVMFSTSDHFTLRQDMCVVCGSFGQGAEGRLLSCSQCGQCYHPYCVNVKVTRVVLTKGWRCLECTVCEACGEASDPARLLLCDDCDISYHTYCLDPPLHTVPKGAWKCKWCVWCVQCGSASPGLHCDWQSNYSRCGPCSSLSRCPLCQRHYTQDDLILQCQQCDRWVHAVCQGLTTEDEVEVAADEGFDCSLCRSHGRSSYGCSDSFDSPFMAQIVSRMREPETKTYTQDGVCLTESGLSHLQSLVEPLTSPRRYRRCKPKLKLRIINQNSVSVLQTPLDPDHPTELDHRGDLECEMKSDSSPERDHARDNDVTKEPEVIDGNKKRKRKPYRPGIGGFMVRQRGGKAGPSRIKLCRKDSTETRLSRDEGLLDADVVMEMASAADQAMEKAKKRYRKKKTKLEEAFPSYLQEAFFGRDLLDRSRQVDRRAGPETAGSQLGAAVGKIKSPAPGIHGPSPTTVLAGAMATNNKQGTLSISEEALVDLSDVLSTDPHILATGHTAGLDISSMADDSSLTSEPTGSGGQGQRAVQDEPLDAILSPELDKMVTDGAILNKLYKIPELEGKDVEEVFTAVLSPNSSNNQHTHSAAGSKTPTHHPAAPFPRLPLMNGLMGAAPHFLNTPMMTSGAQAPAGFRMPPTGGPVLNASTGPAPVLTSTNQQSAGEGAQDVMSTAQRGMLKWEKEETLGELATVAPVLYCNTNFPQLREQHPDWSTRVKQIAKLWRKASSQDRAPFVQKARDNRAAQRINKVQLSNDPLNRHPPPQPPPPPPPPPQLGQYDPMSMDMEGNFKDSLRPKESEQEQEWKFRQGEVKDRWGASKKRQENLPQSKVLKSPTDKDCPHQAPVAGGDKPALQMRQKSKQLAKIEATQKLEQVKNEQLQQQRLLASQHLIGQLSPESGSRSPISPMQQEPASPVHPPAHPNPREGPSRQQPLLQGAGESSGLADNVFLRPQAPPPSGFSSLPHSPHPSSPLHQPPSSPQMFSPPSSRPSSPWDPYSKLAGTPRPSASQPGGPPPHQQQRRNSLSASPAHDAFGSPGRSPDSKACDISWGLGTASGLQQSRPGMMSPHSGSASDHAVRNVGVRAAETFQRTPHNSSNLRVAAELYGRVGELVQSGVFKAPMPPQQEMFGNTGGGGRRDPSRPTDLGFVLPQTLDPSFPSSPLSGLGSPHRSPYAQTPGTPRPDYSQQIPDPFTQQSPLTSRPSPDPYTNPLAPGTPRPHSDPSYLTPPPTLRLDQFNQQPSTRRPSPSHPTLDPYNSNPGTPRPSVSERVPRSPGSQRSTDPYTQQPSTPRPQKGPESFIQAPVENFTPLAPGETFTPTPHQSPGKQQDSFPRSSQTPKHPGMPEDSFPGQTPGHDPFEQGHMTPGLSQIEKTAANEMAVLGVASLDGPMSILPQPGDSEEKLRQRQRLRQLILRQQQQKCALRQEKGLQEPASGPPSSLTVPPAPGSGTPRHWSQDDPSTPPAELFARPPPPYPGTVRPGGLAVAPVSSFPGGFSGEQQRSFTPSDAPFPRQSFPRELGVRGPVLRFTVPPGAPVPQDSFLRPPQGSLPGSGLSGAEGVPVQMRRPLTGEFTGNRPLPSPNALPPMIPGVPQPFLPRSLPIQQHSIRGQPYIELRHRAPENRLRLPFPPPEAPLLHPRDPQLSSVRPSQGPRMGEIPLGVQMVIAGGVEQLNQQHLSHTTALTQSGPESTLPVAEGIEEHLEGEESAVKDLEDVEVKDLVDLNLNLDPEDGKEDLDLGPNDLHLDDFLLSGKFDLIAYADPELNLEDKKDMFNEELDLGEPDDKDGGERSDVAEGSRRTDSHFHPTAQVKQEVKDCVKIEVRDDPSADLHLTTQPGAVARTQGPPGAPGTKAAGSSQVGSSALLAKEKVEDLGVVPALQAHELAPMSVMAPRVQPPAAAGQPSVFQQQQRPFGPSSLLTPHPLAVQPPQHHLLLNTQNQLPHLGASTQNQMQNLSKARPLLLEEQPLLLQELLDQERQEQQQQKQMQALIQQRSTSDTLFPNIEDFDSISDPIMKAKMVALKGINKVMTQGNIGLNPMVINRFQQPPASGDPVPEETPQPPHLAGQDEKLNPPLVRPNPPSFGAGFVNESQRRQYEEWLGETQQLLQMQQRLLEDQIAAHRKAKKALSAKQRTAKKAGRAFAEEDVAQLRSITEQQGAVQKQLEQIRKQQKDHTELIDDYRAKQQRALQPPATPPMMPTEAAPIPQTLLSQPMVPMQPHPGGPTQACVTNVSPGWTPGSTGPGALGQRMPPHLPPTLPNTPQASPHTQTPVMVAGLAAPTAAFNAGPRGPSGGPTGAAGDGAAPTPQVKFDDNNPFSEGFQERERRERLREQQERQRVQLMQEVTPLAVINQDTGSRDAALTLSLCSQVERHRALQQRMELEQQGILGASMGTGVGVAPRVVQTPAPGDPAGPAPAPGADSLSQLPFFSSELPQDFLQSSPAPRPQGAPFAHQPGLHQGLTGPQHPGAHPLPANLQTRPRLPGSVGPSVQGQVRPAGIGPSGITPSNPGGPDARFGHESSSPATPLPSSFSCSSSGAPSPLIQLYSDIIPNDKPKKRRSRKRDGDDIMGGGGGRTPLSSHSDDITAPPTPALSDTSCCTPTPGNVDLSDVSFSGLAPSSELERQLSFSAAAQQRASVLGLECQRGPLSAAPLGVKEEREDGGACGAHVVKMEEGEGEGFSSPSPLHGWGKEGDGGKELLRHLLKDKMSPAITPSLTGQALPNARRQLSNESVRSEEEDKPGSYGNVVMMEDAELMDASNRKKIQRSKRLTRPEKDRATPKYKRRKREEEEKTLQSSSSDPLMTHLRQLSVLPLMEPVLGVDLSLFPPYGSSSLGRDSRLSGSFGNACLDGVTDFYSQLIYKQNNLTNPPTPPASLPPTPPPVARQKLVNGFATTEELSRKEISEQDVKSSSDLKQKGGGLLVVNHAHKTVDVPASLPTPPHNNQEELRIQDSSERNSPDGYVPSSSPESVSDGEISRYPDLSFIKLEPPSPCPSPPIPVMPCAWGKGSAVKQEVKTEPNHQGPPSCSNTDLVTIAITLNPVAAQNVAGVMAAVAELLRIPVPVDYQLSRAPGPEHSSLALLAGVRVPLTQGSSGSRQLRPPAAGNTGIDNQHGGSATVRPKGCSYCKVLLGNGVRIVKELKQEGGSGPGSTLVFCSPNCSALHTSELQSQTPANKPVVPVLLSGSEHPPPSRMQHQYNNNMSSIAVHSLPHTPTTSSSSSPTLSFPPASTITMETRPRVDSLKMKVKLRPHPRAVPGGEDLTRHGKRMKSSRWRRWSVRITFSRGPGITNEAVAVPTEEEVDMMLKKLGACLQPDPLPKDQRRCCFCHQLGDGQTDGPARLLNLDLDLWVHLNCALWSSEVYETQAGALINVELALRRGLSLRCAHCQQTGATSGCNRLRCTNTYHFTCALQAHCTFFKDKTMLCHFHKPRTVPLSGDRSSSCSPSSTPGLTPDPAAMLVSDPYDSELRCFAVFRRVYVQRDEARQIAAVVQRGERQYTFRVGSLLFRAVGRLLPQQMRAFHNQTAIFPVGYHANRIYWSMRHSSRRCKYMCYIEDDDGRPLFKVKVVEKGHDDLILTGLTPKAVWDQILDPVAQMRLSSGTLKLFPAYLKGEDLFGLTTSAVIRIIESLPGVEACGRYSFRYGRNPLMEWPLAFSPSGSARSEPKASQAKRPYLLTSIAPRCQGSVGSIVGLVPGVISLSPGESVASAHQGRHSKSSQYRRMKAEWKSNVYLARSRIQGLGLYAARDIEKCTMVIEYIGTIIRSEVANRKERLYESQNRGVYMFRIDNDYVIDATITGGPARYINHSCAPNCITEVVTVEKENKIIISSCRRIQRGEELSYDYKFDLEDDQHKIPCHCGAVNCSKWMN